MPLNQNDLRDVLSDRADIPTARASRLDEVHRRIRRRRTARAAAAITTSTAAVALLALGTPALVDRLGAKETGGLTVASTPTTTPRSTSACVRPGGFLVHRSPNGEVTVVTACANPRLPTHIGRPQGPARYTITPTDDGLQVLISEMGDLAGLRNDLQRRGVRVVADPSPGFEECADGDYSDGPSVVDPGAWKFVVHPDDFGANRELRLWNGPSYGELLFLHYCKSLR